MMMQVNDTQEKLRIRFRNICKIFRAIVNTTPQDSYKKTLRIDFSKRAQRFSSFIESIKEELSSTENQDPEHFRLRALIFNFEEQILDYLPIIMNDEQIAEFVKTKNIPEGF